MYKNNFCISIIADIHFGKKDDVKLMEELEDNFLYVIRNLKKEEGRFPNMIVIAGDLYDRVIKMNEYSAKLVIDFINNLCEICEKNKILLRIIKGTKTHDFNQLQVFKNLESKYYFFKIINNYDTENIDGLKIAYIPEEYPESVYGYYESFFNNGPYDIIIGHGMIDFIAYTGKEEDSERMVRNAPVFKSKDLMNICNGPIIFGHIHDFHEYKDKIYYCGSFSRYSFADQEDKGYLIIDINKDDTKEFTPVFYENVDAPTYYVLDLEKLKDKDDKEKIKIINNLKKKYDFVKIRAYKNSEENIEILKEITSNDSSIKMEIKNVAVDEDKVDEKYLFILKRENDIFETIKKFIKIKYDKNIELSLVKEILKGE